MKDRRLVVGKIALGATDGVVFITLVLITLLAILFRRRVDGWAVLVLKNFIAGAIYLGVLALGGGSAKTTRGFVLRMAGLLVVLIYINLAVDKLQLVFYGRWLDDSVLKMEDAVFRVQPTVWLQRFISKPLTEWMFFAYVFYMALYPGIACLIYFRKGREAAEDFFFTIGLMNVVCDLGFLAYPVAGPLFHIRSQYTVPLKGYVWTSIGEYLRQNWQFAGGTIPSPHCANATVMWLAAYRSSRPAFWILAPVILSLYASTVYCRYHYVTDSVTGIAAALVVWAIAPACRNAWNGIVRG
jgi:PAP2 superfamily